MNAAFDVIIVVTMCLCFFALSANMQSNIFEQRKEIGVLRSVGLKKNRLILLYFYEAVVLVFSSCILGIIVGVVIAWTMLMQQALFEGSKIPYYFPWE